MFCLKIEKIDIHFNSGNLLVKSHTCHALSFVDKSTLLQKMADPCLITENVQYHSYFLEIRTNRNVSLIYSVTDWWTKTQRITVHVQGAFTPRGGTASNIWWLVQGLAPLERDIFFRPQVCERVGKSVIFACKKAQRANKCISWLWKVEKNVVFLFNYIKTVHLQLLFYSSTTLLFYYSSSDLLRNFGPRVAHIRPYALIY